MDGRAQAGIAPAAAYGQEEADVGVAEDKAFGVLGEGVVGDERRSPRGEVGAQVVEDPLMRSHP